MKPFTTLTSRVVVLPVEDIDTDQIIPARFLKTIHKTGLGEHLFADWRYTAGGTPKPGFVLNRPQARGAQILLAGDNFGCGSSREHAPWALLDWGFRAVVSPSFADIFYNNALKNGLLPVVIEAAAQQALFRALEAAPDAAITVDLLAQSVALPDGRVASFSIDPFSKQCLLQGVDQLGFMLRQEKRITAYERTHPARVNTSIP